MPLLVPKMEPLDYSAAGHNPYLVRALNYAEQTRMTLHASLLYRFGEPYAAAAQRASQGLWIARIFLDRYPTAKVFVYTLLGASAVPLSAFVIGSAFFVLISVFATISGISFFGGGFLLFSLFLSFCLASFVAFW
ncbi:uncharacterized protein EV422DRAFT_99657 [Fimicolochytrium jonesii]|uniref:uncharacterized protein n=1 Tax=Fimicolochytrium jonesii TaxID=1396493 RepID=UPI0022FEA4EB|nr:uncharacterized protein EV422DRAFT_99657 [Fimicolochytrium jonesii]KAI8819623.1 hypothetical protein EV422DRAFT_99657 [Fimicolochytrium jonesii]